MEPGQVCIKVLGFYGGIARSDRHGADNAGPRTSGGLGAFTVERTVKMLKESKKTESRVEGDPLTHLIRSFPHAFADPVSKIYNRINKTGYWPAQWKTEYLTVIPKVPKPADLSECRNISCTSAFSKILEYQVLAKLRAELAPDEGQYGGVPKCGVEHMLLDLWEEVLTAMEGGDMAAILLRVDYEKAFNRMEHDVCLEQLRDLGASSGSITLVRAFLEERRMTIVIDGHKAEPVPIQRGSPQGSVLGCLLYCVTTQNLTKRLHPNPRFFPQNSSDKEDDLVFWNGEEDNSSAFLYIDDTMLFDKVAVGRATRHLSTAAPRAHFDELELECDFRELDSRAKGINMKINTKKTQLLVIGPPNGYTHSASMRVGEDETIQSVDKQKLVGFTFGTRPGVADHVEAIKSKFMRKIWMLYRLRNAGFRERPLHRLYCCFLRTAVEYCSVVYHPMLTSELENDLEKLNRLAARICFGSDLPTDDIMALNDIESLKERRIRRCDAFLKKALASPRFGPKWFPRSLGTRTGLRVQ